MTSSGHATVDAIIAKWAVAFTRLDAEAMAALYSEHALFYGSVPTLFRGRTGVADYFNALTRWPAPRVEFSDVVVVPIGETILNMAGQATFIRNAELPPLHVKITWIIVQEKDGWMIISHHVSPIAPLVKQD